MPSKTASKAADSANRGKDNGNFVNDYLADWDDEDPFRSPSPDPARNDKENGKKKDVLGIEKELDLKRKPRAPRVKLDETRLLSDKGIPKLRKTAQKLRLKGKGHEFSDAARLLSFYQEWLDDLFPKANFLDALAMVEKAGHKGTMRIARQQWIDESKPKAAAAEDDEDYRIHQGRFGPQQADRVAPIFENAAKTAGERAKTPSAEDLFGDDDIYNATPRQNTDSTAPSRQLADNGIPDEDDLDALMAEAEAESGAAQRTTSGPSSAPFESIFGNGGRGTEPDDDELDALMAEAEAEVSSGPARPSQPAANMSIFGDGKSKQQTTSSGGDEGDDLDALMAEAEAEAEAVAAARPSHDTKAAPSAQADTGQPTLDFDDDEQAMAEMEGLW